MALVLFGALATHSHGQITFRGASSAGIKMAVGSPVWMGYEGTASASSGNLTPQLPLDWQPNDIFMCVIESRDNVPSTMPAGWTLLNQGSGASGLHRATIFWKRAAAGDTAPTVTHTGGGRIIAQIYGISSVDMASPFDAPSSFTSSPAGLTTDADAITPVTNQHMLLFLAQIGARSTSPGSVSGGTGSWFNIGIGSDGAAGDGVSLILHQGGNGLAGVQPAVTLTHSDSAESHGSQIALRGGTTLVLSKPAGTVQNDVMIASIGAFTVFGGAIAPPSGWTLVRKVVSSGNNGLHVYAKAAGASEPAQYVWTLKALEGISGGIQSFAGVDTATPIDVEAGQTTPQSLSHSTPSVTTTVPNAMLVTSHLMVHASVQWTPPAGMTEGFDVSSQKPQFPNGTSLEGSYALQAAAGATGAKTATAAAYAGPGMTHILALRPAPTMQVYYIHPDHLNTPRLIANGAQQTVWRWDNNDPFGNNVPNENPSGLGNFTCNLRLPGQYFDKETNLHYNYFRDYDPAIGRYIQSDPIGLQGGINTYAYANGNPLSHADPLGLVPLGQVAVIAGAAITIYAAVSTAEALYRAHAAYRRCIDEKQKTLADCRRKEEEEVAKAMRNEPSDVRGAMAAQNRAVQELLACTIDVGKAASEGLGRAFRWIPGFAR